MEERTPTRKYQRREFIKTSAKAGAGITLGAGGGYLTGKTYKAGRDAYREKVKPYVEKGKEIIDKGAETKDRVENWWDKYFNKEKYARREQEEAEIEIQKQARQPEKTSRRGFLQKYFHFFNGF